MIRPIATIFTIALLSGAVWAAKEFNPRGPAITAYMDAHRGARTNRAAKAMTELHAKYHQAGYQVIDVDLYVEDGDLQGFFITYRKD